MRSIFTIILLVCTTHINAQIEIGTTWQYCQHSFAPPPIGHPDSIRTIRAVKDTFINNTRYIKLEGTCACDDLFPDQSFYLIREDSNRTYYYLDGQEHLLYDFNLNAGDVLRIYWPFLSGDDYADSLRLQIDSIGVWPLGAAGAKVQYLSPVPGYSYLADWGNRFIQGIGGSYFECFVPQWGLCEISTQPLLSFENPANGTGFVFGLDQCMLTSASEAIKTIVISISPNPSSGLFHIRVDNPKIEKIEIYNVVGQMIQTVALQQKQIEPVDLTGMASGVYIIRAIARDGRVLGITRVVKRD